MQPGPPFRDAWMDGFSLLAGHSTWMEKVGEGCRGGRLRGTLNHRKSANLPLPVHLLVTGDRRRATGYSTGLLISQARRTLIQAEAAEILLLNTVTGMDGIKTLLSTVAIYQLQSRPMMPVRQSHDDARASH
jgi:hypothetical protein